MKTNSRRKLAASFWGVVFLGAVSALGQTQLNYQVYVTNEKSGGLTVIDGASRKVLGTVPVGKRPRGIRVSPDGKTLFIAVSGTPIAPPPKLDAKGNPIFQKGKDD